MYKIKFTQGNNQVVNVSISNDSKKKFGSFGFMWLVSFDNNTSQFMDHKTILKATGIDMLKRGGIYHKYNQAIINKSLTVNGYKISFNYFWGEWQTSHKDIGANLFNSVHLGKCIEFAEKG